MVITTSDAHEEGASQEHAVQELCRPLRRSQTAHFMPGPSEGKPQNLDDPLRQALIAITEPQTAKRFFLKQLKAAEQESYCQDYGKIFRLKDRGLVDVTKGIEVYAQQRFTALHILYPGSALLSMNVFSPFKLGYESYDEWEKKKGDNGRMQNILVHEQELKNEFRKHLPDLKHLFIHHYYEGHKMWAGNDPTCDDRIVKICSINALFELDMTPATIGNLLSKFLAAFFKILADKSFKMEREGRRLQQDESSVTGSIAVTSL